jgi:hypothetical protein
MGFPLSQYAVVVRNLRTGVDTTYPVAPELLRNGVVRGIIRLSWAADGRRLAISLGKQFDHTVASLVVMDTTTARYYMSGAAGEGVPVISGPDPAHSSYSEGVFLPDGSLFVDRVCCAGVLPSWVTSNLAWEVTTSGAVVRQVVDLAPRSLIQSLAVDVTGQELLYLEDHDLLIVEGEQRARPVTGASIPASVQLLSAAWIPGSAQSREKDLGEP